MIKYLETYPSLSEHAGATEADPRAITTTKNMLTQRENTRLSLGVS